MTLNLKNRSIYCKDNLEVLRGINSETIDLIYLDPPFNKNKTFTAPIGSSAMGASFSDIFRKEDIKEDWVESIKETNLELHNFLSSINEFNKRNYNYCYLVYMAIRLLEMRRILKGSGSLYLHCDPTMSHYLKLLLDIVLGENNFRNEITWCYSKWIAPSKRNFQRNHDIILYYSKSNDTVFKNVLKEIDLKREITLKRGYTTNLLKDGTRQLIIYKGSENKNNIIKLKKSKKFQNIIIKNPTGNPLKDYWDINIIHPKAKERTGYPTQKPLALLERIIKASSNEGDLVLDPFCGCATTCVASEKLNRKWVGVDVSQKAYELVKHRLLKEVQGKNEEEGKFNMFDIEKDIVFSTEAPIRTDEGKNDIKERYVYIISHPSHKGFYKVGITNDYKRRLNSYQTSCPNRSYKLEYKVLTAKYKEIERHIHQGFKSIYEWVSADLEDIIKEIENYK